jgi:hypothetical protein
MGFASLLLDGMTSSGIFLQSAYKIPANFNDARARGDPLFIRITGLPGLAGCAQGQ